MSILLFELPWSLHFVIFLFNLSVFGLGDCIHDSLFLLFYLPVDFWGDWVYFRLFNRASWNGLHESLLWDFKDYHNLLLLHLDNIEFLIPHGWLKFLIRLITLRIFYLIHVPEVGNSDVLELPNHLDPVVDLPQAHLVLGIGEYGALLAVI